MSRQCCVASLKGKIKTSETLVIKSLESSNQCKKSGGPIEYLIPIQFYEENDGNIVKMSLLNEDMRNKLI